MVSGGGLMTSQQFKEQVTAPSLPAQLDPSFAECHHWLPQPRTGVQFNVRRQAASFSMKRFMVEGLRVDNFVGLNHN
jgi:hypothetical protein